MNDAGAWHDNLYSPRFCCNLKISRPIHQLVTYDVIKFPNFKDINEVKRAVYLPKAEARFLSVINLLSFYFSHPEIVK